MQTKYFSIAILFALATLSVFIFLSACDEDTVMESDGTVCAGAVWGYVTDTDGEPLKGVEVTLRDGVGTNASTDGDGFFFILGANIGEEIDVQFVKKGYAKTHKPVSLFKGVLTSLEMRMKAVERSGLRSIDGDYSEKLDDGSGLKLSPGSLVDADGNAVQGDIEVEVTSLVVRSDDIDAAPGNFRGVNDDGSETKMESFGILDMNFKKDGQPLQLGEGQTALVSYPVEEGTKQEGDVVPLWYYDTEEAKWVREGECTVQPNEAGDGLECVGEVSHFSSWNMDDPSYTTCLSGVLRDVNGEPVPGVSVRSYGTNYAGTDQQYSREDGTFFILMQPGEHVILTFYKEEIDKRLEVDAPSTPYTDESSCEDMGEVKLVYDTAEVTQLPGLPEDFNLCVNVYDEVTELAGCGE